MRTPILREIIEKFANKKVRIFPILSVDHTRGYQYIFKDFHFSTNILTIQKNYINNLQTQEFIKNLYLQSF